MTIVNPVLDPVLLSLAGVAVELWRFKDWASDLVILRLASVNTVSKVTALSTKMMDQHPCCALYSIF